MTERHDRPDGDVSLALAMHSSPGRFALLLGSGISQSSGIPTGWAVVTDIATKLAALEGVDPLPVDPVGWYVERFGTEPDYSHLLAGVAPTPAQRRDLLSGYFEPTAEEREEGAKAPTSAHRAIAKLVARGIVRIIVTPNFDRLLEQAIQAEGVEPSVVATASAAEGATPLAHSRCTIIKVHGDYLDPNIRNTIGELAEYEPALDALLDQVFDEYGLVVCGWSATWDTALRAAIQRSPMRRFATYWATVGPPSAEAERVVAARDAVWMEISGADELFDGLLGKIEALVDLARRRGAIGSDVLIAQAKRYLPDPVHRIRLHDLVLDAAGRAVSSIDFDGNPGDSSVDAYLRTMTRLEGASVDGVVAMAVLGQFADRPDHFGLIRRVFNATTSPAVERLGGYTDWVSLRRYPALLVFYGTGLAAVAAENWASLATVVSTTVPDDEGSEVSIVERLAWWGHLNPDAVNTKFAAPGRKTPLSDHLYEWLTDTLSPAIAGAAKQFEVVFDQWEYLLGVTLTGLIGRAPIGRMGWKHTYAWDDRRPNQAVAAVSEQLVQRGVFDSDDSLAQAKAEYDKQIGASSLRFS